MPTVFALSVAVPYILTSFDCWKSPTCYASSRKSLSHFDKYHAGSDLFVWFSCFSFAGSWLHGPMVWDSQGILRSLEKSWKIREMERAREKLGNFNLVPKTRRKYAIKTSNKIGKRGHPCNSVANL